MFPRLVGCVAAVVFLAGCCSLPFSPEDVPLGAPAEGGTGPRTVTIHVLDPDEPADAVPLYIFWEDPEKSDDLYLLGLRSAAGRAVAHVPDDVTLHVVAGGGNRTIEWSLDLISVGAGPVEATVRVYPLEVEGEFEGTWSPAAASLRRDTGMTGIDWQLQDETPGTSEEARVGYAKRLTQVSANLTWSNDLTTRADLGIGVRHLADNESQCRFQDDEDELTEEGEQTTSFDTKLGYSVGCGRTDGEYGILIGPGTARLALMPFGLDYQGNYTLSFGFPSDLEDACERMSGEYQLHYVDPETGATQRTASGTGTYNEAPGPLPALAILLALALVVLWRRQRK